MATKIKRSLSTIGLISIITLSTLIQISAQYRQIVLGAGIAPIHKSGQSDFTALKMPYDVFVGYQQDAIGVRLDYNWNGTYQKENFSFTNKGIELSLTYSLKELFNLIKINPYVRAGASKWQTDFTTQGYPGITDYELKTERDQGYGIIGAVGTNYKIRSFAIGIEAQYAKNGKSQLIAGGFDPQPLSSDQFRLMITAQYALPIAISSPSGFAVTCPKF